MHPEPADWERQKVRNDDSIVLELRWRDVSVLLTGDIGKAVERTLTTTLGPARLRVIKVPHHGSLTSSTTEFVRALHPNVAVVSAGRANHFGHPVPEVLERYRAVGAEIFRTDQDGAVTLDTDGVLARRAHVHGQARRICCIWHSSRRHEDHEGHEAGDRSLEVRSTAVRRRRTADRANDRLLRRGSSRARALA